MAEYKWKTVSDYHFVVRKQSEQLGEELVLAEFNKDKPESPETIETILKTLTDSTSNVKGMIADFSEVDDFRYARGILGMLVKKNIPELYIVADKGSKIWERLSWLGTDKCSKQKIYLFCSVDEAASAYEKRISGK